MSFPKMTAEHRIADLERQLAESKQETIDVHQKLYAERNAHDDAALYIDALLSALPHCSLCGTRPATRGHLVGAYRYCDDCGADVPDDNQYAGPLRALLRARKA